MYDQVINDFQVELETLQHSFSSPLERAEAAIPLCNLSVSRLQEIVEQEDFSDVPEEIKFFKCIKAIPMGYLIYFSEVRSCELRKPKIGSSFKKRFFEKELRKVNKFFQKNINFVHYMEQGHSYLDHQFFTRHHRNNFPFTPMTNYYQYPDFSTSHDMLWSKVQAMYRFIHYLREALEELQPGQLEFAHDKKHKILVWSGSKVALVELIYALYSSEAINHGTADLATIASSFEDFFNVKLDGIYKTYSEIKARKGERTKYLHELILNLEKKMVQDDH